MSNLPYACGKDFQLYLGDCVKILSEWEPEQVDMIFADPPYRLSNDGTTCRGRER